MSMVMKKEEAHKLIDQMPTNATWDDLMHEIYVREAIERGLTDSKAGRTKEVKEIKAKYGLPERRSTGQKLQRDILMPSMLSLPRTLPSMPNVWLIALREDLSRLPNFLSQAGEFLNTTLTRSEK